MRYILLILMVCVVAFPACQELTELDLPNEKPRLVIEAELTDSSGPHTVKLTLTQDYFSESTPIFVEDAIVTISDDVGNTDILQLAEDGLYISQNLEGVVGRNYTLTVEWGGDIYQSTGTLLQEAIIDSLNYRYFDDSNPLFDEGYYLFFFGRVPTGRINNYRFKVYKNDSLFNDRTDLLIQDTEFLPDTIQNIRFAYPFEHGDTVKLEMYALNKDMYQYYLELITLLFNDGGLFSPPPQNPKSNIRNITNPAKPPLGYFQVASVTSDTIVIDRNKAIK